MSEFTAQVQTLGRIAIPKPVRDIEGIIEGDYVVVTVRKTEKKRAKQN